MKAKHINDIMAVLFAFFIQGFCGMVSIPKLEGVPLVLAMWQCFPLVRKEGKGRIAFTRKKLLSLIKEPMMFYLLLSIFLLVVIDVGANMIGTMVMVERFGWNAEEVMKVSWVYLICHTIGLLLGAFLIKRVNFIVYFRCHVIMGGVAMLLLVFCRFSPIVVFVLVGVVAMLCAGNLSMMCSMALQGEKSKDSLVSGMVITMIACGGLVASLIGQVVDGITIMGSILLACMLFLVYSAFDIAAEEKCRL